MTDDANTARVRVYNVGFGDSILLDLPTPDGRRARVLIDCGSISFGTSGANNESVVQRIIGDVTDDDGVARIDVVVATHRHKDHVSGFEREEWANVQVKEVWQPWTEDRSDKDARSLRAAQLSLAGAIESSGPRLAASPAVDPDTAELIVKMGMNALSNQGAVNTLETGFASKPRRRYLACDPQPLRPRALGRLAVHVLGPTRDVDVIERMDPPSGQSYLAMLPADPADPAGGEPDDGPFPWLAHMTWEEYGSPEHNGGTRRKIDHGFAKGQLRALVRSDSLLSAVGLDHALNNTSLMLCFEVGDQFLLFPGDAQWGAWNAAMDAAWSAAILRRTTFYKVGHHGSHNATPVKFVEEMMHGGCWAVASVAPYSRWQDIPKPDLIKALEKRSPGRVFTTMNPPAAPPSEVDVHDDGAVLEFTMQVSW